MTYWLGKSSLFLPNQLRNFVLEHYSIIDALYDVSVITEHTVSYCFFLADQDFDERLLVMCIRICKNLNKKLILFHHSSIPKHYLDEGLIYGSVNLTSSNPMKELTLIDTKLRALEASVTQCSHNIGSPSQLSSSDTNNTILETMVQYVENNYTTQIKEQDVATHCHLSVSYFSRVFHKQVGESFRDYVCNKRINLAKQLLKEDTELQISSIAFQAGFNDLSYFSRMFKKKTGMSPSTYRNLQGTLEVSKDL